MITLIMISLIITRMNIIKALRLIKESLRRAHFILFYFWGKFSYGVDKFKKRKEFGEIFCSNTLGRDLISLIIIRMIILRSIRLIQKSLTRASVCLFWGANIGKTWNCLIMK